VISPYQKKSSKTIRRIPMVIRAAMPQPNTIWDTTRKWQRLYSWSMLSREIPNSRSRRVHSDASRSVKCLGPVTVAVRDVKTSRPDRRSAVIKNGKIMKRAIIAIKRKMSLNADVAKKRMKRRNQFIIAHSNQSRGNKPPSRNVV